MPFSTRDDDYCSDCAYLQDQIENLESEVNDLSQTVQERDNEIAALKELINQMHFEETLND